MPWFLEVLYSSLIMVRIGTETCNSAIINIKLCQDAYLLKLITSAFFQINYNSHDAKEPFHVSRKVVVK